MKIKMENEKINIWFPELSCDDNYIDKLCNELKKRSNVEIIEGDGATLDEKLANKIDAVIVDGEYRSKDIFGENINYQKIPCKLMHCPSPEVKKNLESVGFGRLGAIIPTSGSKEIKEYADSLIEMIRKYRIMGEKN